MTLHSHVRYKERLARTAITGCVMCSGSEAGSYLRLIDSCITQLQAQGPSRTCDESKEEEEDEEVSSYGRPQRA